MSKTEHPIGVLFSSTGSYSVIGREACDGVAIAIEQVNASDLFDFRFKPVAADPAGKAEQYAVLAQRMMAEDGCRHIIGCQTSWSRKELLPVLERYQGLLWYSVPYEGFESHDRVIYSGACPNQNVVPLFRKIMPQYGKCAFLVGSNYIWGWEMNRIARELLAAEDGSVLGERYVALGDMEVDHLISEIAATRPDFIFNNLIGVSSYAFLRGVRELGLSDPAFRPDVMPVLSCNLTEAELPIIGSAAEGVISTASYFETADYPQNREFVRRMHEARGEDMGVSAMFTGPYQSVWALAQAIKACGTAEPDTVRDFLSTMPVPTPVGPLEIDRDTQHATLAPFIGVVEGSGEAGASRRQFRVLNQDARRLAPDPYLVNFNSERSERLRSRQDLEAGGPASGGRNFLRVVK
ncbi:transporter substrate-binding domain-containing protein [Roseibium aggregatum]|uniref:Transporter substrate-binding domain-containing protein n=1 Tax=Roseibium aggregatum TaxID=187304 RepID=A0A939J541_9HYPH|nr:transporter substrate-binding domain-containing protein [Roseibium aggregatum]MBN9672282.1 transporter substrate-binding domain-containing protein [Roseibium aggregatum]